MATNAAEPRFKIAIVGAGPVGTFMSILLSKELQQSTIILYEHRQENFNSTGGRSINLTISERGKRALGEVDMDEVVESIGMPVKGRAVHNGQKSTEKLQYGTAHQCIWSVNRQGILDRLLLEASRRPNVEIRFNCKLRSVDFEHNEMKFVTTDNQGALVEFRETADLIIGADGTNSVVREELELAGHCKAEKQFSDHEYIEVAFPATHAKTLTMDGRYLHLWPRGNHVLLALPNRGGSFTGSLFMPSETFESNAKTETFFQFFCKEFPDAINLFDRKELKRSLSHQPSKLATVKCFPHHFENKVILVGDAAHAMVPFYGQGMNTGLEDCIVLRNLLRKHKWNLALALDEYSATRPIDTGVICDLSLKNYLDITKGVQARSFNVAWKLDRVFNKVIPAYKTKYQMVVFSTMPYHLIERHLQRQQKCVIFVGLLFLLLCIALLLILL